VAVFKRKGVRADLQKIEKPQITPVETNADKQSLFVQAVDQMPSTPSLPVFLDFAKDIQKNKVGKAEVLYVQNTDNQLYRLRFRYKVGTLNDLKLSLATQYIQFLGTDKKTAEQISKEFYKIASSFTISSSEEYTTVTIEGLQENFAQAVKLYEDLVANVQPNEEALTALKARLLKGRKDAKLNKQAIMQGLTNYALYGPQNKFNYTLTDAQIESLTAQELIGQIKQLNSYEQSVIYYGPARIAEFTAALKPLHAVPATFARVKPAAVFKQVEQTQNQVLFTDYNMVQAETRWVRNSGTYDPKNTAVIQVFNNYFGGGMGSLVFQTIRESKALAYSTYGIYNSPLKEEDKYFMLGYVGTQADKFNEAVKSMNELFNNLPELPVNLELAKNQVKKDIQTERITQDNIIFRYLAAQRLGLKVDIRKQVYDNVDKVTMNDLKAFHRSEIANKPYAYAIVASESKLPVDQLNRLGTVKKISLEELFGY
jgi:predicted Zn-dependent peptidase